MCAPTAELGPLPVRCVQLTFDDSQLTFTLATPALPMPIRFDSNLRWTPRSELVSLATMCNITGARVAFPFDAKDGVQSLHRST